VIEAGSHDHALVKIALGRGIGSGNGMGEITEPVQERRLGTSQEILSGFYDSAGVNGFTGGFWECGIYDSRVVATAGSYLHGEEKNEQPSDHDQPPCHRGDKQEA
jgi:hypothetical protein